MVRRGGPSEPAPSTHSISRSNHDAIASSSTTLASSSSSSSLPLLPPEILYQIFSSPSLSFLLHPTSSVHSTLTSLLLVNRLAHDCATRQLYDGLVLPRRVSDLKRWYDKERSKGWRMRGVVRGVFCALEDVSKLTHTSSGWETCLLRTLNILGPGITHLSLWYSESKHLLRDVSQQRKDRTQIGIAAKGVPGSRGERGGGEDEADEDEDESLWDLDESSDSPSETNEEGQTGDKIEDPGLDHLNSAQRAERAAQRERARQQVPMWLRRELENSTSAADIARRHRAHLLPFTDPNDRLDDDGAMKKLQEQVALQAHIAPPARFKGKSNGNRHRDNRPQTGCQPSSLSLILSLPLFENQSPALFSSLNVFSKVQDLDIFIPVPSHTPKLLWLLAHLIDAPLRRLKVGTKHATLIMARPPFNREMQVEMDAGRISWRRDVRYHRRRWRQEERERRKHRQQPGHSCDSSSPPQHFPRPPSDPYSPHLPNLALSLRNIMDTAHLRDALVWELAGKHTDPPESDTLVRLLKEKALEAIGQQGQTATNGAREMAFAARTDVRGKRGKAAHLASQTAAQSTSANSNANAISGTSPSSFSASANAHEGSPTSYQLPTPPPLPPSIPPLRLLLLQGSSVNTKFGKMANRREDFVQRLSGQSEGVWSQCGVWDEDDDGGGSGGQGGQDHPGVSEGDQGVQLGLATPDPDSGSSYPQLAPAAAPQRETSEREEYWSGDEEEQEDDHAHGRRVPGVPGARGRDAFW